MLLIKVTKYQDNSCYKNSALQVILRILCCGVFTSVSLVGIMIFSDANIDFILYFVFIFIFLKCSLQEEDLQEVSSFSQAENSRD